jgi:hypothetical protein
MRISRALVPLAWTLVAAVLVTAGWAGYMLTDPLAGHRQQALQQSLHRQWQSAPGRICRPQAHPDRIHLVAGHPFALIRIPAFGRSWRFAIVEAPAWPSWPWGRGTSGAPSCPGSPATSWWPRTT